MDENQQVRLDILKTSIDNYYRDPEHRVADVTNALEMIWGILNNHLRGVDDKKL